MIRYVLLIGLAIMWPSLAIAEGNPSMSLSGTGTVKAKPDEGYITVGVKSVSQKSADAVRHNSKTMASLFKTLQDNGVKEEGIKTIEFSVSDNYKETWEQDPETKQRIRKHVKDGFVVLNLVHITVCDVDKFGEVLDAVVESGANQIHSISFGSSKSQSLLDEARKSAVKEAQAKAKTLTSALGVKLGKIVAVHEEINYNYQRQFYATREAADRGQPVPLSGGSLSFSVTVHVKWEVWELDGGN